MIFEIYSDEMLERDYKFYFAIENAICRDYVIEKLYKSLEFSAVPIVYSLADYEKVTGVPRKAYIDVRDFASRKLNYFSSHKNIRIQVIRM